MNMLLLPSVAVVGATGHTGRFVVDELLRRGRGVIAIGRDEAKLKALQMRHPALRIRTLAQGDHALRASLRDASAVINCAGPLVDTYRPVIQAALHNRIHYADISAEQHVVQDTFARFSAPAQAAGVLILPAAAFFGGLADLLASAITCDWQAIDAIDVAVALDGWHPTSGTRETGRRNTAQRLVREGGVLTGLVTSAPSRTWTFQSPFGQQNMVEVPLSEIITLGSHLNVRSIHSWMNLAPLAELRDPATPAPQAVDDRGRSSQRFVMTVAARRDGVARHISAAGRDIYAISAPLVVEAVERVLRLQPRSSGVHALGALFDARDVLDALDDIQLSEVVLE
jgi:short subunit dehydrogenase-like uncharacterized protein